MVSKDIVFKTRLSLLCLLPQVLGAFRIALRSWLMPSFDYGLGSKVIFPGSCPGLSKHISTLFGPRLSQSLITCFIVFITMSLRRSTGLPLLLECELPEGRDISLFLLYLYAQDGGSGREACIWSHLPSCRQTQNSEYIPCVFLLLSHPNAWNKLNQYQLYFIYICIYELYYI